MTAQVGDKVRIKSTNKRGVVVRVVGMKSTIRLDSTGELVNFLGSEITNYSLAARKAWEKMPERRVGRPKGSVTTDRVSVTLRLDRELWERFKAAEATGAIQDRTATVNSLISQFLSELDSVK